MLMIAKVGAILTIHIQKKISFHIHSLTLLEFYEYLMEFGGNESLCYGFGIIDGDKCYPSILLKPEMKHQSPGGVEEDSHSNLDMLRFASTYGATLLVLAHKHPGNLLQPSMTDLRTHGILERGHEHLIGMIFTKPGNFRIFRANHIKEKFHFKFYGTGVNVIDEDELQFSLDINKINSFKKLFRPKNYIQRRKFQFNVSKKELTKGKKPIARKKMVDKIKSDVKKQIEDD